MNAERIASALRPDHSSQSAYTGRIVQKEELSLLDSEGNSIQVTVDVLITWETIKAVLDMVRDRAQL